MNSHLPSDGVWFPNWAAVLSKVRLKDLDRRAYRLAIVGYLSFCKRARQRATVASARLFMAEVEARRRLSRSQLAVCKGVSPAFIKTQIHFVCLIVILMCATFIFLFSAAGRHRLPTPLRSAGVPPAGWPGVPPGERNWRRDAA